MTIRLNVYHAIMKQDIQVDFSFITENLSLSEAQHEHSFSIKFIYAEAVNMDVFPHRMYNTAHCGGV